MEPINTKEIQTGCLFGSFGAGVIFIIGMLLTATGIGAIIGIPLMIVGIIFPFVNIGNSTLIGSCPYCGNEIIALKNEPGVTCKACKQRIIVRDGIFYKLK
jgi:DNA-directed RNA polymerase subunit RPC12/RpoP